MASKAKSGLSAVRMFPETILEPPNTFSTGDASFASAVRDGKGHAAIHASVTNDTGGELQILQAWRSAGPFVKVFAKALTLDAASGFFTADLTVPVVRRYVQVKFVPTAAPPGLGANFELGAYFLPRADSPVMGVGGSGSATVQVAGDPGATITSPADTAVASTVTAALPVPPAGTRRMSVQVTGGDNTTVIRVREAGGAAGAGRKLLLNGSTVYGGLDGAVGALEVENVTGPAAAVSITFEGD